LLGAFRSRICLEIDLHGKSGSNTSPATFPPRPDSGPGDPVGLQVFAGARFNQRWGVFAAGVLLGALPIMLIDHLRQDQIVGGLTQGAVKGSWPSTQQVCRL